MQSGLALAREALGIAMLYEQWLRELTHTPLHPVAFVPERLRKLAAVHEEVWMSVLIKEGAELLFAGTVAMQINIMHRRATIRSAMVPGMRRRGVGMEAKRLLVDYGFRDLSLNKICSTLFSDNAGTFVINSRLGFKLEAVLHDHEIVRGKPRTLFEMGLLRRDWLARTLDERIASM